ncbi:SGNH/GDSL hydrolase family protein [Bradyrhizobium liaoningense]|uniref:SGNH/GDSL hydrolase family protein n=1 Tax=Bradyrhizobium liaoningense TaxID=43992 RepID=UPI001BA4C356|nr:SGNH/GDSL hydrolase family protein [Bradyrhizobium liaoningense]MBR0844322.1 SGNH/GDSL hydrolase family protein [Bradyrhizobium liaoningense]MBR0857268.1 SGNH/GDSL hydrolase family protein [Bradyrhizobium liaoningense]
MSDTLPAVDFPRDIIKLKHPLLNFVGALRGEGPVRIVAMGSSSTAGRADVVPYPYHLEMYLRQSYADHLPKVRIDVLNRGKGGEEAPKELERFNADIFNDKPTVVLWQVGTNAVFRKQEFKFDEVVDKIAEGVRLLGQHPMDVVLIDPQYVTAMLRDDKAELSEKMVSEIRRIADDAKVNVFQRWALMRHWHVNSGVSFEQLLDPTDGDKLHQSDWSTLQVAKALCNSIVDATVAASWLPAEWKS